MLMLMGVDFAHSTMAVREVTNILACNIQRCGAAHAAKKGVPAEVASTLEVAAYILKRNNAAASHRSIRLRSEQEINSISVLPESRKLMTKPSAVNLKLHAVHPTSED